MISAQEMKAAYDVMLKAEDFRLDAELKLEKANDDLIDAEDAEVLDLDLSNPATQAKANAKMRKAAKKELSTYRKAKAHSLKANSAYKKTGIVVDSLVRQQKAEELALLQK
jgi:hypothetical protein